MKIAVMPGDGIGPEVTAEAVKVLKAVLGPHQALELGFAAIGQAGIDAAGDPLPAATSEIARRADAILFGAAGIPGDEAIPFMMRPGASLLRLRKALGLFANFRPAFLFPELIGASTLKPEVVSDLDILIIRELTGDIYFGEPRGRRTNARGEPEGYDTMLYSEPEIRRIAEVGFAAAMKRGRKLCSVDKENVLETSRFWREIVNDVAKRYPQVALSHMYVDNAAMQLVRAPKQFDVIVTGNIFGDILSDEAAGLLRSLGMGPSASLNEKGFGLYEPIHGSAPDIAGQGKANPLATILSAAMMLRLSFDLPEAAKAVEDAVDRVLAAGARTGDLASAGDTIITTQEMGKRVAEAI